MSFNQTRDILEYARRFHRRLGTLYKEMQDRAPAEKTRTLLENLIGHEQQLDRKLGEFEQNLAPGILNTFFKYMTENTDCLDEYRVPPSVTSDEAIAAARNFDGCLGRFYREMAQRAMSEKVKEVLLNLLEMELHEQMTLSKKALECCSGC